MEGMRIPTADIIKKIYVNPFIFQVLLRISPNEDHHYHDFQSFTQHH
jgi:hypothetical protein